MADPAGIEFNSQKFDQSADRASPVHGQGRGSHRRDAKRDDHRGGQPRRPAQRGRSLRRVIQHLFQTSIACLCGTDKRDRQQIKKSSEENLGRFFYYVYLAGLEGGASSSASCLAPCPSVIASTSSCGSSLVLPRGRVICPSRMIAAITH